MERENMSIFTDATKPRTIAEMIKRSERSGHGTDVPEETLSKMEEELALYTQGLKRVEEFQVPALVFTTGDPLSEEAGELVRLSIMDAAHKVADEAKAAAQDYLSEAEKTFQQVQEWTSTLITVAECMANKIAVRHSSLRAAMKDLETLKGKVSLE